MADYLVFRLYGPLCSWGEIAVGESRHTADHPSRSALLGLFAAALGIERADEQAQQELALAWSFGIKLLSPGTLLRDYHTVQAPRRQKNVRHRTRRSELMADDINTLLSAREYRVDSVSVIAAHAVDNSRERLEQMHAALKAPCFPLYLGRKSCPLALPLDPRILSVDTLRAALDCEQLPMIGLSKQWKDKPEEGSTRPWERDASQLRLPKQARYYLEANPSEADGFGSADGRTIEFARHDQPLSRRRWQFRPRREFLYFPSDAVADGTIRQEDQA